MSRCFDGLHLLDFELDCLLFKLYLKKFCFVALIDLAREAIVKVALEGRRIFVGEGG